MPLCIFTLASELFFLICDRNTSTILTLAEFFLQENSSFFGMTK
jgi:hypothetical protein